MSRGGLLATLVATMALGVTDRVAADPAQLYPVDLRVLGEGAWRSDDVFQVEWTRPPIAEAEIDIAAVAYRVRAADGAIVRPRTRLGGDRNPIDVRVPPLPGLYTAEVWLEAENGEHGPARGVTLRYDHARPGTPRPVSPEGWITGSMPVTISVQPPEGPVPLSGIRGYAVSVDRGGESWPCEARDRCREAEVDLRADTGDGLLSLGTLPEGATVVRAVAVSGAGVPSAESGSATVRVDSTPPAMKIEGAPPGWSNGPVSLVARATDPLSGMSPAGPNGPYTAIAVDDGVPRIELGGAAKVTVAGEGVHGISLFARDAAGNRGDRSPDTATISIDESPPLVAFAAAQDAAEPERIEATIADALSGADPDRGSIGVREAGTADPWRALPTAARAGRLVAHWDSGSFPEGVYEFRATGYDRAGNVASSNQRANRARMVLVNPLKEAVRLRAGLPGDRATPYSYGRRVPYGGRLTTAAGSPLGGLPVQVVESFGPGAAERGRSTKVLTAADGSFSVRLAPGPSRELEARFAGTRTLGSAAAGAARLQVLGSVVLRVSARTARVGGAPIVFSGRVGRRGARLPSSGLPVELRFEVPGGEWSEFRTVRTDARGRFQYAYAFSDDDSRGVRFRFRAYISGGDWPYEPAASKAVSVAGR
jgi:hypothetical protein